MKGTFSKQTDKRAKGGKGMEDNVPSKEQKKKQNMCLSPRNACSKLFIFMC